VSQLNAITAQIDKMPIHTIKEVRNRVKTVSYIQLHVIKII
jgi:hypothetical protein